MELGSPDDSDDDGSQEPPEADESDVNDGGGGSAFEEVKDAAKDVADSKLEEVRGSDDSDTNESDTDDGGEEGGSSLFGWAVLIIFGILAAVFGGIGDDGPGGPPGV